MLQFKLCLWLLFSAIYWPPYGIGTLVAWFFSSACVEWAPRWMFHSPLVASAVTLGITASMALMAWRNASGRLVVMHLLHYFCIIYLWTKLVFFSFLLDIKTWYEIANYVDFVLLSLLLWFQYFQPTTLTKRVPYKWKSWNWLMFR